MKAVTFKREGGCIMREYFDKKYRKHHVFQGITIGVIILILLMKFIF